MFEIIDYLSYFIGGPATKILISLLLIALIRIGFSFVLRVIKLDMSYHTLQKHK